MPEANVDGGSESPEKARQILDNYAAIRLELIEERFVKTRRAAEGKHAFLVDGIEEAIASDEYLPGRQVFEGNIVVRRIDVNAFTFVAPGRVLDLPEIGQAAAQDFPSHEGVDVFAGDVFVEQVCCRIRPQLTCERIDEMRAKRASENRSSSSASVSLHAHRTPRKRSRTDTNAAFDSAAARAFRAMRSDRPTFPLSTAKRSRPSKHMMLVCFPLANASKPSCV